MEKLKPCPFCGAEAVMRHVKDDEGDDWYCSGCSNLNCSSDSLWFLKHKMSETAWNTRATDQLLKEMVEALLIAKDIINRYANNNKRIAGYSNIEDALQKYHEQVGDTNAK